MTTRTDVAMGSIWFFHEQRALLSEPERTDPIRSQCRKNRQVRHRPSPSLPFSTSFIVAADLHPRRRRPCARRRSSSPCAGGYRLLDFLLRTVRLPWSRRAESVARWLRCLSPEAAQKKSRLPVAETEESGFWNPRRGEGKFSRSQRSAIYQKMTSDVKQVNWQSYRKH